MPTLGNFHVLIDRHYSVTDLGSVIGTGATVSISVTHVHIGASSDSASVPTSGSRSPRSGGLSHGNWNCFNKIDWGWFTVNGMDRDQSIQGKQLKDLRRRSTGFVPVPVAETPYLTFALFTPFPVSGPDEPPRFLSVNGRETFIQSMRSTSYDASTQSTSFSFATGWSTIRAQEVEMNSPGPGSIDSPSDTVRGGADSFSLLAFAYAPTLSSPRPRDWTSSHCSPRIVESMHYRFGTLTLSPTRVRVR